HVVSPGETAVRSPWRSFGTRRSLCGSRETIRPDDDSGVVETLRYDDTPMPSKLLIAIPNYGNNAPGLFLDSMVRLMTHLARKFGPGEIDYMRVGLMYIDIARNMIW